MYFFYDSLPNLFLGNPWVVNQGFLNLAQCKLRYVNGCKVGGLLNLIKNMRILWEIPDHQCQKLKSKELKN